MSSSVTEKSGRRRVISSSSKGLTALPRHEITVDRNVYELALDRTERAFDIFDRVSVQFSGGKDSTATLQVVLEVAARRDYGPVDVVFFDEEAIPIQTEEYVRRVAARDDVDLRWYCLPVQHRNACSRRHPYWWPWAPEAEDLWVRPMPPEAITELAGFEVEPPELRLTIPELTGLLHTGRDRYGTFMGIRAQESLTRRRSVTQKVTENFIVEEAGARQSGNLWKVYPIYDWQTEDVWTAPLKLGWDYNRAYDLMEMAGVSHPMQRVSPAFGEEPLQKLWTFATCFPEVWDKMQHRVPGAAAAGRYALTELWSYGATPEPPPGTAFEAHVLHYIKQWPEEYRTKVANHVAQWVKTHARKSSDPLVWKAPHPETGVSWEWLTKLAMRGDFKNRKQAGSRIAGPQDPERRKVQQERYDAERKAMGL